MATILKSEDILTFPSAKREELALVSQPDVISNLSDSENVIGCYEENNKLRTGAIYIIRTDPHLRECCHIPTVNGIYDIASLSTADDSHQSSFFSIDSTGCVTLYDHSSERTKGDNGDDQHLKMIQALNLDHCSSSDITASVGTSISTNKK